MIQKKINPLSKYFNKWNLYSMKNLETLLLNQAGNRVILLSQMNLITNLFMMAMKTNNLKRLKNKEDLSYQRMIIEKVYLSMKMKK